MNTIQFDPDYLCAIALQFSDDNHYDDRHAASQIAGPGQQHPQINPILDALARLIVNKPQGQVVAIASMLDQHNHVELYVAVNPADSSLNKTITAHLEDICTRLLDVRTALTNSPNCPDLLLKLYKAPHCSLSDSREAPAFASLRALELDLYKYSNKRILANFKKNKRNDSFIYVLDCIEDPATARHTLSERDRTALERLRGSEVTQLYLPKLRWAIDNLTNLSDANLDDEATLVTLRQVSILLDRAAHWLKDDMEHFDSFIACMSFFALNLRFASDTQSL